MRKLYLAATLAAFCVGPASAQTSPGLTTGQIPTASQWNSYFSSKQNYPLPNTGTAGTYGDATHVPQITTDAQGRITSITPILITAGASITWPASGTVVISNTTNSPSGIAEVDGDCLLGAGGVWTAGSCGGAGSIGGSGTAGHLTAWSATTTIGNTNLTGDVTTSGGVATTLATVNTNTGSCGDATHVCQVTLNGKGLATAAAAVSITGGGVTSVATGCGLTGGPITATGTVAANYAINAQTGTTYPIASTDMCKLVTFSNASPIAVSLVQATTAGFTAGASFDVQNKGAGLVTITPATSTINGATTLTVAQNTGCTIISDGTNYQVSQCTALASGAGPTIAAGSGISVAGAGCTSGSTSTCTITNTGASSAAAAPQGRLTCTTATPVQKADVASCTTIYYDTYQGNLYPNWNGSSMANITITADEISMGLDSGTPHIASGSLYDVFGVSTGAICAGPAWTNATTRSIAIALKVGVWTNNASMTHCWGGASGTTDLGTVAQFAGTYLGTFQATANGTTKMTFKPSGSAGGTNNCMCLYNAYNRVPMLSLVRDSTSTFSINATSWQVFNIAATGSGLNNRISFVDGLGQSAIATSMFDFAQLDSAVSSAAAYIGVNLDATTGAPNLFGAFYSGAAGPASEGLPMTAIESFTPQLGFHYIQAMENTAVGQISFAAANQYGLSLQMGM